MIISKMRKMWWYSTLVSMTLGLGGGASISSILSSYRPCFFLRCFLYSDERLCNRNRDANIRNGVGASLGGGANRLAFA